MNVPSLYFRLPDPPGVALDYSKTDYNLRAVLDFLSALNGLEFAVLNADGTLKDGAVSTTAKFADRVVTAAKLAWWANLFCVAVGTDAYSATILPNVSYTGPGTGVTATAFLLVKFGSSNTGASTFVLNGATAYPIVTPRGVALTAGDIHAGKIYPLIFNGTSWVLMSDRVATLAPTSAQFIVGLVADQITNPWAGAGVMVKVLWDTEEKDPNNTFDTGTHHFTAPTTGRYQFVIGAATMQYSLFELRVNGVKAHSWMAEVVGTGSNWIQFAGSLCGVFNLTATNTVDVWASADTSDSLGRAIFGNTMHFYGYKLIE